jgi:SAM-dependent methyltransferase
MSTPWGKLYYRIVLAQLPPMKDLHILDFGAGFGIVADHLAAVNNVTAYEPNVAMLSMYPHVNTFAQTDKLPSGTFDAIICHNVMEYVPDRTEYIRMMHGLLNPGGLLSLVKHNRNGKVMAKIVFDNDTNIDADESSVSFGKINYYDIAEFEPYFAIEKTYGVQAFFGLQRNEIKYAADWEDRMFNVERRAEEIPAFRDVAYFHHIILHKKSK